MAAVREIRKSVVVAHRAQDMFGLVNDVESYPQFLPWCASARVLERDDSSMLASLDMAMAGLHKRVTTRNLLRTASARGIAPGGGAVQPLSRGVDLR